MAHPPAKAEPRFLPRPRLQRLLDVLRDNGYECVGPRVRDGAIVYEAIGSADELPYGVRDRQAPGEYRLDRNAGTRCFAWAISLSFIGRDDSAISVVPWIIAATPVPDPPPVTAMFESGCVCI